MLSQRLLNNIIIRGVVLPDPEMNVTSHGVPVANLKLFVPVSAKSSLDNMFQVRAYNRVAEFVEQNVHKHSIVKIKGHLRQEAWTTKNTGERVSRIVIVATRIDTETENEYGDYTQISSSIEW